MILLQFAIKPSKLNLNLALGKSPLWYSNMCHFLATIQIFSLFHYKSKSDAILKKSSVIYSCSACTDLCTEYRKHKQQKEAPQGLVLNKCIKCKGSTVWPPAQRRQTDKRPRVRIALRAVHFRIMTAYYSESQRPPLSLSPSPLPPPPHFFCAGARAARRGAEPRRSSNEQHWPVTPRLLLVLVRAATGANPA